MTTYSTFHTGSESTYPSAHIFDAYRCIEEWFQEAPGQPDVRKAMNVLRSLNEFVRIIWYEVPPEVDQTTLFTRLNVGRIPLTDAELVKALVGLVSSQAESFTRPRLLGIVLPCLVLMAKDGKGRRAARYPPVNTR